MLKRLLGIIPKVGDQFTDVRYEKVHKVVITFDGKELSDMSSNISDGFNTRVFRDGAMASGNFALLNNAPYVIKRLSDSARLISRHSEKKVFLEPTPPVKDVVRLSLKIDPRKIPLKEKHELLKHYNDMVLAQDQIQTTKLSYNEVLRKKIYVTSEGTAIEQEMLTTSIKGVIWAQKNNLIQDIRVAVGGSTGFEPLLNRERSFMEKARLCKKLLDAEPVKAGKYTVLLDNQIGGLFIHEAFGHLSDADFIEDTPIQKKMVFNRKLGCDELNIVDDATIENSLSYYKYDDEGIKSSRTQLMKNGVLVGRLHSRQTAFCYGEPLSGNCIAEDYSYPPIIRMSNIYVQPGHRSFKDLIGSIDQGLYICGGKGGQTIGDIFSFGAQYGYEIRKGKLGKMLRNINMSGNLFSTLKNIRMIGNDLKFSEAGACGKGQINIKSCYGAPHMVVNKLVIGGI